MNQQFTMTRWQRDDADDRPIPFAGNEGEWTLGIAGEPGRYEGEIVLDVPAEGGALVLEWRSPRPLRLWLDDLLAVDEPLYWRSFQREIRGTVVVPCRAGRIRLRAQTGERPSIAPYAAANCPSRNRERVMETLNRTRPDELALRGAFVAGIAPSPVGLRYETAQHQADGIMYQHVLVRRLPDFRRGPSLDCRSTAEAAPAEFALRSDRLPGYTVKDVSTAAEREAGLRRYGVPVADELDPLPALRGDEPEARIEPHLEICRHDRLRLETEAGAIAVPLPVYESLGRLAPAKTYRRLAWPSEAQLAASVPEPVLPPELASLRVLYDAAWRMLHSRIREPRDTSGLPNGYLSTGSNFPHNQFVWDTAFTSVAAAYGYRALPPTASLDVLYRTQFDGGYIHRELDVRDLMPVLYEPDFGPNPPILTYAEWAIAGLTGDRLRLKRVYPALKALHGWIARNRRQDDGTYWTTGLANGLDNSPSYGNGYPCLTAQMAHDAELLGAIAGLLGYDEEAARWRAEYEETVRALNDKLWDPVARIYAASLDEGGHNPNKIVTAFWPLLAGAAPPDRAEALAAHLTDPASFWRYHPIPSVAADSPAFVPGGDYWLGSAWAPTNYAAIRGFQRAGYASLAYEASLKHLHAMLEVYRDTGEIWENYCSEAPKKGSASAPSYSWSALGPIALLLETVVGLQPDALAGRIVWSPPTKTEIGARRYPLGEATVDLDVRDEEDGWHVHVRADRPFDLVWRPHGEEAQCWPCRPGHQRFPLAWL